MHPTNREFLPPAPVRTPERNLRPAAPHPTGPRGVIRSQSHISRLASDESWIEVASQPSSSSVSSVAPDEVITTGLRVTQSGNPRRRQRLRRSAASDASPYVRRSASSTESSQEEYDESESGSDPNMTSSNLSYQARFLDEGEGNESSDGAVGDVSPDEVDAEAEAAAEACSDDDTALGEPSPVFTPQPNAFSHPPPTRLPPPISRASTATAPDSYFPSVSSARDGSSAATTSTPPTSTSSIPSRQHNRTRSHTPYTLLQPTHTVSVDHDAALRASLSTLLSCAAAARGLPKREVSQDLPTSTRAPARVEAGSFRLISESVLDVQSSPDAPDQPPRRLSQTTSPASSFHSGSKRRKSPARDKGKENYPRNKKRRATPDRATETTTMFSPTLVTWVLGAGVMVLFSALSFSAGYALGREIGRVEAAHLPGGGVYAVGAEDGGMGFLERSVGGIKSRVWRWGNGSGIRA